MSFEFIQSSALQILEGFHWAIYLSLPAVFVGFVLAIFITLARQSRFKLLQVPANFYVFVFRGSPLLIQMYLIYNGSGQFRAFLHSIGLWSILREPVWCAIIALSLNSAAYVAEIMRGSLLAVPKQQIEVARSVGMSGFLLFRRITFPIAMRHALPAYSNEIILIIKSTSIVSLIGIMDMTGIAGNLIKTNYHFLTIFIVAGIFYLVINFIVIRIFAYLEWKLSSHRRPQNNLQEASDG